MIGKYARGFRHLMRSVEASKVKKVFILQKTIKNGSLRILVLESVEIQAEEVHKNFQKMKMVFVLMENIFKHILL